MKGENVPDFGCHYTPFNFDSNPEKSFFEETLRQLNLEPDDVEEFLFTGALAGRARTDFFVEYKDEKGKWRRYTPDFVIRRKSEEGGRPGSGKVCIVEVKSERDRNHVSDGEAGRKAMALRKWEDLNPERIKYEMIFTPSSIVTPDQTERVRDWLERDLGPRG